MNTARTTAAVIVALAIGAGALWASTRPAPMAPKVTYTLLDGRTSSLADLRGKVVLVNFWATTCTACVHEMPQLAALHEALAARGFETLAVAMRYDAPANVIAFAHARKLPFGVVIDNTGAVANGFGGVEGTPTSVLVNQRGEIVERFTGEPDFTALRQRVEKLLARS